MDSGSGFSSVRPAGFCGHSWKKRQILKAETFVLVHNIFLFVIVVTWSLSLVKLMIKEELIPSAAVRDGVVVDVLFKSRCLILWADISH